MTPAARALVTAGARRVGAAIVDALTDAGWRVAVHSRSPSSSGRAGTRCIHGDLSTEAGCLSVMDQAQDALEGCPDIIVNNAAVLEDDDPATVGHAAIMRHHAVNVAAPAVLTRLLAERHEGRRDASVVNVLDQRIANPISDQLSYTLSKLALADLTRILARHHAPRIRVNGVAPGLVLPAPGYEEGRMERIGGMMPLGRNARVDEIAEAVVFLAGSTSITGQIVHVDGGAHLVRFPRDFDRL